MNIYRIHPGLDAFQINDAYVPYLDVIAEGPIHAIAEGCKIIPDIDGLHSINNISRYPEFIQTF